MCQAIQAQNSLYVFDSATNTPLTGVSLVVSKYSVINFSDLEGRVLLPRQLNAYDSIQVSCLGYERKIYSASTLPTTIFLSPRNYILQAAVIRPIEPKTYIQNAFDSFYSNHLPKAFSQKVFYREEFIVNDQYARFQEMDVEVYQFQKNKDNRKYYVSGSFPKIHKFYKKDDSFLLNDIKASLGKIAGSQFKYDYLTGYSYIKGVNMLNFIFTQLLENKDIEYKYLGIESVKGYQAIHIRGHYFKNKVNYNNIDIYLEENTLAVLYITVQANDENLTKQFLDFKTRTILWLLGIKINVKKYYSKIQFTQTKHGFWTVDDFMLMFPVSIEKKKKLDMYLNIGYRMDPSLNFNSKPLGYSVYQENQHLFDTKSENLRFSDELKYNIPILPSQIERLNRMRIK